MSDTDTNYEQGTFADRVGESHFGLVLEPPARGLEYDDIFKVSHCRDCEFTNIEVRAGRQKENAVDLNRESTNNRFSKLVLDAGQQGAILVKGGSSNNSFSDVLIRKSGGHSDIMIGGFSGQSKKASKNNSFDNIRREDGKPVTYAYTFLRAEKPRFTNSRVKFQFFWSLVRTIAQEISYLTR